MDEPPVQVCGQAGKCVEQDIRALFLDQATDRQNDHTIGNRLSDAGRAFNRGGWKPFQVETVVNEFHAIFRSQLREVLAIRRGAGDQPGARRELFPQFPIRRSPYVLGMRRPGPRQTD